MGKPKGFEFDGPEQIWNGARAFWLEGVGLACSCLDSKNLYWPRPDKMHTGTPMLHRERLPDGKTTAPTPIAYIPTLEWPDDDYPFLLTTGHVLRHFNADTTSYRTPNAVLQSSDTLDMTPADAARYGFIGGGMVEVTSRYGSAIPPLHISHAMQIGQLFCGFYRADLLINRSTFPVRGRLMHTPKYKVTTVRVRKRSG